MFRAQQFIQTLPRHSTKVHFLRVEEVLKGSPNASEARQSTFLIFARDTLRLSILKTHEEINSTVSKKNTKPSFIVHPQMFFLFRIYLQEI